MKISLIVPVLNEEEAIPVFYRAVRSFPAFQGQDVEILFINDGSIDRTETIICGLAEKDSLVRPIPLPATLARKRVSCAVFTMLPAMWSFPWMWICRTPSK